MSSLILLLILSIAPLPQQAQRIGDFRYVPRLDPITDEDTSYIITEDVNATLMRTGKLIWKCSSDGLDLYIDSDEYLGRQPIEVVCRFDRKTPWPTTNWINSTDGSSAFANRSQLALFTENALPANQVVVRLKDYEGSSYTYTFSLKGLTQALGRLGCATEHLLRSRGPQRGERWSYVPQVNPATGEDASYIYVTGESSIESTPRLKWQCSSPTSMRVYLETGSPIQFGTMVSVIWQVDAAPPSERGTWYSFGSEGVIYAITEVFKEFTAAAERGMQVKLTVWDGPGKQYDFTFDVTGLRAQLAKLPCGPPEY